MIIETGEYKTRSGLTAVVESVSYGFYADGYIMLKTKNVYRHWNINTGFKVCFSKYGKNPQDLVEKIA
jgi:hypothetical protein